MGTRATIAATGAILLLAVMPAAAAAVTMTVDKNGGGCTRAGPDRTCGTIAAANAQAQDGDTISIKAGVWGESLTFTQDNLTLLGQLRQTFVTGAGGDTLTFEGAGTSVRDLDVSAADGAGSPIVARDDIALIRVIAVAAASSEPGVEVVSAADGGADKEVVIDSSVIVGGSGAQNVGLLARTEAGLLLAAGDIALTVRHLTTTGQPRGIELIAQNDAVSAGGDIVANVADSIAHGASHVETGGANEPSATLNFSTSDAPAATTSGANATANMGGATNTPDAQLFANPGAGKLHLRADSPAKDKGTAPPGAGHSTTDLDGQKRDVNGSNPANAGPSDLGADEFHNRAPTVASLGLSTTAIDTGQSVDLTANAAADPEAGIGGGVWSFRWDFGDGSQQTTAASSTSHQYTQAGTFTPTVRAVDRQGLQGPARAGGQITVTDPPAGGAGGDGGGGASGGPQLPTVFAPPSAAPAVLPPGTIVFLSYPRYADRVLRTVRVSYRGRIFTTRRSVMFFGRAADRAGLHSIELALRPRRVLYGGRIVTPRACYWFDGLRRLARGSCAAPDFFSATLADFDWHWRLDRRVPLPIGIYELGVRARNLMGAVTSTFTLAARTRVLFIIR